MLETIHLVVIRKAMRVEEHRIPRAWGRGPAGGGKFFTDIRRAWVSLQGLSLVIFLVDR